MAAQTDTYVYLEELEEATYTGKESPKVWNQAILCAYVGQCKQRILGSSGQRNNAASSVHKQPSPSRLPLPDGLLRSNAPKMRNRRMPNGTYGGVRGRKTKVGGKLTTFVFLLLDSSFYLTCGVIAKSL